ncbi:MAG: cytochrome c [Gemmatimonadota bacterium]
MRDWFKKPFGQAFMVMAGAYVIVKWGIPYLPPLVGVTSAPVPGSVMLQYMLTVAVGVLVWVSENEARWKEFKRPILQTLVLPERKSLRITLLVAFPFLVGFATYDTVRPKVTAPAALRSVHPAPPSQITFQGETIQLDGLENPMRVAGREEEAFRTGMDLYYRNCMACHGDYLDGQGHFAQGFNPTPLPLRGGGTIAQLTESYVFWRIAKGGPGLPREGAPWNSAMPAWEDFLSVEEIWAVTLFLYEQAGLTPRTWEEH